jgi:hypothetical protein
MIHPITRAMIDELKRIAGDEPYRAEEIAQAEQWVDAEGVDLKRALDECYRATLVLQVLMIRNHYGGPMRN